jgi:hypothetical protein
LTRAPWIVSARYDGGFFTGSVLVPLVLWLGFSLGLWSGVALYVLFQLAFNLPHHIQTWSMSVLDEQTRATEKARYLFWGTLMFVGLALPMTWSPQGIYPWVRDALVYWGYFHLVRQHAGFVKIYERKSGGVSAWESFAYARFVDVVSYVPLLLRFAKPGWMTVSAGGREVTVWHWAFGPSAVTALWALYAAVVTVAFVHHAVEWRRRAMLPRALYLAMVTLSFGLINLGVENFIAAVAMVTALHNVQYGGLTHFHNRARVRAGEVRGNPLLGWLANGQFKTYLAVLFGYGVVLLAPRALWKGALWAELPISWAVAMHYVVDAGVWRMKRHPERARWLGLRRTPIVEPTP